MTLVEIGEGRGTEFDESVNRTFDLASLRNVVMGSAFQPLFYWYLFLHDNNLKLENNEKVVKVKEWRQEEVIVELPVDWSPTETNQEAIADAKGSAMWIVFVLRSFSCFNTEIGRIMLRNPLRLANLATVARPLAAAPRAAVWAPSFHIFLSYIRREYILLEVILNFTIVIASLRIDPFCFDSQLRNFASPFLALFPLV